MSPQRLKTLGGKAWTNDEITHFLSLTTSLRNKAIIHLIASTGCRIGALENLKIKHISDMPENCKSVSFYENSTEEYFSFCTSESSHVLDMYLEERRKAGEYLTPESPLFRNTYRVAIGKAKPMSLKGYKSMLHEIMKKVRGKGDGLRYEKSMFHAFRHRFNTILKNNREINISLAERLMGHFNKLIPTDTTYHNPSPNILFEEFKKAIPDLTLDNSERERLRRVEAEKKVETMSEQQTMKMLELESKLKTVFGILAELKKN